MLQYVVTCKRTLTNEKYTQLFAIIHFTLNVILSNQFQKISGNYCSMEELILIHTHQYWLSIKSATPLHQKYKICMKNNYKTYSLGACLRNVLTVLRYIAVLIIKKYSNFIGNNITNQYYHDFHKQFCVTTLSWEMGDVQRRYVE